MTAPRTNLLHTLRHHRLVLSLAVWLLAATHLAGFAHFALVQHEQCPEHGDWLHVESGHKHADALDTLAWHAPDTLDRHDHCGADTVLRDRVTSPSAVRLPHLLTAGHTLAPPPTVPYVAWLPAAVWRTAPKTSPPLHA